MQTEYQICKTCVMDNTATEFQHTKNGCNFCDMARKALVEVHGLGGFKIPKGEQYDCLIGLSGGVDSSYALMKLVDLGYSPLCFSVDTGWNDPIADENIMKLVEGLKVPFFRYVIDIQKFKKLQATFLQSGTKNIEIPTDHILLAVTMEVAKEYGIKTIISGGNVATESIMPESWGYQARDLTHIKDIYRTFAHKELSGLPTYSLWQFNIDKWIRKIKTIYILDYFDYDREQAIKALEERFNFRRTGAKHEENVWTKWFQNFYLFEKFGIDKRKAHLSSLIVSGQITRTEAMDVLSTNPVYPQLGIEDRVMKYPRNDYRKYKTNEKLFNFISRIVKTIR